MSGFDKFMGSFGTASSALASGFGLLDSIFGFSANRQYQYQKELQDRQNAFNQEMMREQMKRQFDYNHSLMEFQNEYNTKNMSTQYLYNQLLSNKARDIYSMRSNGINPAVSNGVSSGSGSVSLPSTTPLGSSPVGLAGGAPSYSLPHQPFSAAAFGALSDSLLKSSQRNYYNSQSKKLNIEMQTQLERQIAEIENLKAQALKAGKDAGYTAVQLKQLEDSFNDRLKEIQARAEYYNKSAQAAEKNADSNARTADAAVQNAATNVKTQEETVRHNQAVEAIQRAANAINSRAVSVEEAKVQPIIDEMKAKTRSLNASANLTDQEIIWYAEKTMSILDINASTIEKLKAEARVKNLDADWYVERVLSDQLIEVARVVGDYLPAGQIKKIAGTIKQETEGRTPQGYKTKTTKEWTVGPDGKPSWQQ